MSHAVPREWLGTSIRNDGLLREKARFRVRNVAIYFAAVALPLGALLFYILQGVQVIRLGYEIDRLRREYQVLQAEHGRLEVELATLQNLGSIEILARRDLDMIDPEPHQVVQVQVQERPSGLQAHRDNGSEEAQSPPSGNRALVFLRRVSEAM